MSEIRFLTSSDEHLSDQTPILRKDDYRASILGKLAWQGETAKKFRATAVLRGGDFFHVKAANKTSMATMVNAIALHAQYSCPVFSVVGNHDMSHNDPSSIPRQPLGVMLESGTFRQLRDEVFEDGSMSVRVVGVNYTPGLDDDKLRAAVSKRDHTYTIAVIHALAEYAPEARTQAFFNEKIFDYRDLVYDGCPDVYVFGHYHKDQSIRELHGVKFVNLGAISRGALTFENMERKPKVSLIRCNSQGVFVEEAVIPHMDASDVFDVERKQMADTREKSMKEFMDKLRSNALLSTGSTIKARHEDFLRSEHPQDLKDTVTEVLEAAESGVEEL